MVSFRTCFFIPSYCSSFRSPLSQVVQIWLPPCTVSQTYTTLSHAPAALVNIQHKFSLVPQLISFQFWLTDAHSDTPFHLYVGPCNRVKRGHGGGWNDEIVHSSRKNSLWLCCLFVLPLSPTHWSTHSSSRSGYDLETPDVPRWYVRSPFFAFRLFTLVPPPLAGDILTLLYEPFYLKIET